MKSRYLEIFLKEHEKYHYRALDWFIASWGKQGVERELCLKKYGEWSEEAHKVTLRMLNT